MSGTHEAPENLDKNLKIGLLINSVFTIFEFVVGILSGSLALVSDAGHNLTDSLSIIISLIANKASKRVANEEHSYGYGRVTIMAALLNANILVLLALYIFYEAYHRILSHEHPVEGTTIIIVAIIGVIANGSIAFLLNKNKKDLNVRSTFINIALDAVALVFTLLAGILIVITKATIIDPIISIFIGLMLLYGGWGVVKDAFHILIEGIPEGIDVKKVKETICNVPGVKGIDDLHIWALSSHYAALSCHVIITPCTLQESIKLTEKIKDELHEKFDIEHATLETELTEGPHDKERMDEGM